MKNVFLKVFLFSIIFLSKNTVNAQTIKDIQDSVNIYHKEANYDKMLNKSLELFYFTRRTKGEKSIEYSDAAYWVSRSLFYLKKYGEIKEFADLSYFISNSNYNNIDTIFYLKSFYVGLIYHVLNNSGLAASYYNQSLMSMKKLKLDNTSFYNYVTNKFEKAYSEIDLNYYDSIEKINKELTDEFYQLQNEISKLEQDFSTIKIPESLFLTKNQALKDLYNKVYKFTVTNGYGYAQYWHFIGILNLRGQLFNLNHQFDSSIYMFKNSINISKKHLFYKISSDVHISYSRLFGLYSYKLNDYKQSYYFAIKKNEVVEKLFNNNSNSFFNSVSDIIYISEKLNLKQTISLKQYLIDRVKEMTIRDWHKEEYQKLNQNYCSFYYFKVNELNKAGDFYYGINMNKEAVELYQLSNFYIEEYRNKRINAERCNKNFENLNCSNYLGLLKCYKGLSDFENIQKYLYVTIKLLQNERLDSSFRSNKYLVLAGVMISNKKLSKDLIDSGYKYADKKLLDLYYITNARLSFFKSDFLNCIKFYELAIKNSKYENNIINLKTGIGSNLNISASKINLNLGGIDELKEANERLIKDYINNVKLLNNNHSLSYINGMLHTFDKFVHLQIKSNNSDLIKMNYYNILFTKGFLLKNTFYNKKSTENIENNYLLREIKLMKDSMYRLKINNNYRKVAELDLNINNLEEKVKYNIFKSENEYFEEYNKLSEFHKYVPKNSISTEFSFNYKCTDNLLTLDSTFFSYYNIISNTNEIFYQSLFNYQVNRKLFSFKPNLFYLSSEISLLFDTYFSSIPTNINNIYFSLSSNLNQINLGAIKTRDGKFLLEKYNLHQMISTSTLIEKYNEPEKGPIYLFGGIDYNINNSAKSIESSNEGFFLLNNTSSQASRSRNIAWNYLPGTKKEVDMISKFYDEKNIKYVLVSGKEANEELFKNFSGNSPKVIHLATHGYFYENEKIQQDSNSEFNFETNSKFQINNDPLIRSGIILSGANDEWLGKSKNLKEDGILTAFEISNLDLSNTDLVVLSACETGLGDIDASEGVFGLQRAFKIAGVKYLIMSLWSVPDKETSEFMEIFYSKWLSGYKIHEAFKETQLEMIKKYRDQPEKWAAFVLIE